MCVSTLNANTVTNTSPVFLRYQHSHYFNSSQITPTYL